MEEKGETVMRREEKRRRERIRKEEKREGGVSGSKAKIRTLECILSI